MNRSSPDDLRDRSMLELFRAESDNQTALLTSGLLELERGPATPDQLEALMRAAHSLKGAARLVDLAPAVWIAHAMEDCFVAAQRGELLLSQTEIDILLRGVDLLQDIGRHSEGDLSAWAEAHRNAMEQFLNALARMLGRSAVVAVHRPLPGLGLALSPDPKLPPASGGTPAEPKPGPPERLVRLTADCINRLLGLAGESLVESRWLQPFTQNLQRLKRLHDAVDESFERLRTALGERELPEPAAVHLQDVAGRLRECARLLSERLHELEQFDRRSAQLAHRLYLEVLRTRMRPFSDGVRHFPRLVRDLARALGKEVHLEISGEHTQVDRDILDKLEGPLGHLLRNAVDHGCETPSERRRLQKPVPALIRLEARHRAGVLLVAVSDDGAGVNLERLRDAVTRQGLIPPARAREMGERELLSFLFLPGFTLKDEVTEISGRGVGLDVVRTALKEVRGTVTVTTQPGRGTRFEMQLPLTVSVVRTLLVSIGGEPYAIPLSHIHQTVCLPREKLETLEGRPHFRLRNGPVGLLSAQQVLGEPGPEVAGDPLAVVVLGDRSAQHGLVVDQFLGERELVVQPLDPLLGKVQDISAAALMEDGMPVLIVDVEDLLRSAERLIASGTALRTDAWAPPRAVPRRKRVLAVDDSLTVRELVRKLLLNHGYAVDVARDGLDAWNAVRMDHYDLVITDVDMPRMDGFELTRLLKQDPKLSSVPVLLVSYKDRDEDRVRGLAVGAAAYLTKSSFHEEKLLRTVADLIGQGET